MGIIMRKSDDTTGRMFRMFLPFQPNSWIATAMSIVVTGFILSLVSILSPYTRKSDKPWYKNVWLAFGAFFGQCKMDVIFLSFIIHVSQRINFFILFGLI